MLDILMVKQLNEYIDKAIMGKKNDKTCNQSIPGEEFSLTGSELHKVVDTLSEMDFSSTGRIKDELKRRLLEGIRSKNKEDCTNDELDIDDLDHVAGGLNAYSNDFEDDLKK